MNYPKAKEDQVPFILHGKDLNDPYQWMRNNKDPQLLKWVEEENTYTDAFFKDHQDIYQKYLERNQNKKHSPSYSNITKSPHGYMLTRSVGDEYQIIEVNDDFEEVRNFKDMLKQIENTTFFSGAVCPNDENIAFFHGLIDGRDRPSIFIFDLNRQQCIHTIDGIFQCIFDSQGKSIIYGDAKVDLEKNMTYNNLQHYDIEKDQTTCLISYPNNAILIEAYCENGTIVGQVEVDYSNNQLYIQSGDDFKVYNETPACITYCGTTSQGHIIRTHVHKENGQLILLSHDLKEETILFDEDNIILKEAKCVGDTIYLFATKDVSSVAYVIDEKGTHEIALPKNCCASIANGSDVNAQDILVTIESFVLPPQLYRIQNQQCVPVFASSLQEDPMIEVKQVFYPSVEDHTMIPAYLIYRKDCQKDGNMKTLMYGYGGYNVSMPPNYHNPFIGLDIIDWVNDGGLYVHCNLRGGNEYGEKWHTDGYKLKKKNCYYDFIGIAEGIIRDGWTKPSRIAINGGSNGGLLMCALLTMRPDLWGCVIASVPHTDMISFAYDDRGPMYITEYGDPQDLEQFNYFLSYSPFHNIQKIDYPSIYIQTGECDNNVPPYHGKKMAARLQQYNTSDNPILLRVLEKGSHDRGKGDVYIQTISEMQTFVDIALNK